MKINDASIYIRLPRDLKVKAQKKAKRSGNYNVSRMVRMWLEQICQ